LLVVFEELENFSTNQWQGVSTRLKRDTTSDTCIYEEKNEKSFTAKNISNYIINSNVDAIKDDDGRRYFILDLSSKRKGDINYFNKIYNECMNDEVGEAFFSYLHTVDLTGYHDQDFPNTNAKEDAIVKRLDSVARYIKEKYILKYRNFDTNLKDAHKEYTDFCSLNNIKESCKIEFNKKLESYKITSYKSNNIPNKFNYKHEKLEEIATANKWKHKTDQYENKDEFVDDSLDNGINKDMEDKDAEIKSLREQIEILKNKLAANPLDANVEEKEEEPPKIDPVVEIVDIDYFKMLMQECEDNKTWIEEFMKTIKPKKKLDKKKLNRDIFEIDFMCD
jgi:hypothetical protein